MCAQVALKDLSWEDKELVLRVLFSKINTAESSKVKSGMDALQQMQEQLQLGQSDDPPVFISQGAIPFQETEDLGQAAGMRRGSGRDFTALNEGSLQFSLSDSYSQHLDG